MRISKFNNFLLNEEIKAKGVYYIFEKPFRVDDLISFVKSTKYKLFTINDIARWCKKYEFDKDAIGLFVSKKKIKKDIEPFKRIDKDYEESGIDIENIDIENIEDDSYDEKEDYIDLKELLNMVPDEDLELRISSRGTKNKIWFKAESQGMAGEIIEECKIKYGDDELFLFIFQSGKNNDERARQLHGFIYEDKVKKDFIEKERDLAKGERWDAVGRLNLEFIKNRINDGSAKVSFNNKEITENSNILESNFNSKATFFWSVKATSSPTIYFGDFKRISGLIYNKNTGKLSFDKSELEKYMLVVGKHKKGEFIKEYVIEVDLKKWMKYLPDLKNPEVFSMLEKMYQELNKHKATTKKEQESGQKAWNDYIEKYSKLTDGEYKISLNFKRDSKGQIRIQSSVSGKLFEKILSENKHILLEKR